jgi:hypothetical protein
MIFSREVIHDLSFTYKASIKTKSKNGKCGDVGPRLGSNTNPNSNLLFDVSTTAPMLAPKTEAEPVL